MRIYSTIFSNKSFHFEDETDREFLENHDHLCPKIIWPSRNEYNYQEIDRKKLVLNLAK